MKKMELLTGPRLSFLLIQFVFLCSSPVLAWGPGHDDVNRLALTITPAELKGLLGGEYQAKFVNLSHAPDDFTPWEELKYITISHDDLAFLKLHGCKSPFYLHAHRFPGPIINFILIVRAMRDKNPERMAMWMACLMHTCADEVSCNHESLIEYITYALDPSGKQGGFKIKCGDGIGLDFADVARTEEGVRIIQALLKGYQPAVFSEDSQEAILKLRERRLEAGTFMTRRAAPIATTYGLNASEEIRRNGMKALAELGIYGVKSGMDAIMTAWKLAQAGQEPELTPEFLQRCQREYQSQENKWFENKPLDDDSVYWGLLEGALKDKPAVGVLIEPSFTYPEAKLYFGSSVITASIMRTLKNGGVPYRPVDLREMEKKGLPSPALMPALIIYAGNYGVSKQGRENLRIYTQTGGRLIWIGGKYDRQLFDVLSNSLKEADEKLLPVSRKNGQNNLHIINKLRILFQGPFQEALGDRAYSFTHNPDTKAGMHKPQCFYKVEPQLPGIHILAELKTDETVLNIAAALMDDKGKALCVFVPEYLIAPYLLSDETSMADPSKLELDSVGKKILFSSLRMMVPDILKDYRNAL